MLLAAAAILVGYLAGSIPFGVIFGKLRGVDLRDHGSGNIGATNAARVLGKPLGVLVLLCDAAKGYLPVWGASVLVAPRVPHGAWVVVAVGAAAFLGHLAPPWLGWKGGKGVATGFGVFLAVAVYPALIAAGVFALAYAIWRISSVGSLAAATAFVPALWAFGGAPEQLVLAGVLWVLIVVKHRSNIQRLVRHEEQKI